MMIIYFPQIPELLLFHCDTPSRGIASAVIFPTETRLNRQKIVYSFDYGFMVAQVPTTIRTKALVAHFYLIGTDRKKADTQHHQR